MGEVNRKILFIWFPYWCLQRLLVSQPELQAKAVILYAKEGKRGERVVACSRKAMQGGVRSGMPLTEVQALGVPRTAIRRSASSVQAHTHRTRTHPVSSWYVAPWDSAEDIKQLQHLAAWCRTFTPFVGLEPLLVTTGGRVTEGVGGRGGAPEGVVLDISGTCHLWGGEQPLADALFAGLTAQGYRCRIAVAPHLGAAWALAHADPRAAQTPLVLLEEPQRTESLLSLPVQALRIPADTVRTLQELGLTHWSHLAQLPRYALQTRLGELLLQRWDQAWGARSETWEVEPILPEWEVSQTLEYPTHHQKILADWLRRLADRLCQLLRDHQRGVLQLACHLRSVDSPPTLLTIQLYCPTIQAQHLTSLMELQLEQTKCGPVDLLRLVAMQTAPLPEQQLRFWSEEDSQAASRQIAPLLDRLSNRLGRDRVLQVQFHADAQPEHAYRLHPWLGSQIRSKKGQVQLPARKIPRGPLLRPSYLLAEPLPLQVELSPQGEPVSFRCKQIRQVVVRCWGPERIETGWWRRPMVRRDYYLVEVPTGDRLWLFRNNLSEAHWFLHGLFG